MNTKGMHVILDLYGCEYTLIGEELFRVLSRAAGSTALKYVQHDFKPQGQTGLMLLAESHISMHTYPEHNYVSVDIYTCGEHTDPSRAIPLILAWFKPRDADVKIIERGTRKSVKTERE